ncbi:MAG: RNA polymerase subunit sigma [Planctomycetaceae bacterium]
MSGPIVRTGTTPKFWENWDRAFGGAGKTDAVKKSTAKAPASAKKAAAKKSVKKTKK